MKPFVTETDDREEWRARILRALAELEDGPSVERIRMEASVEADAVSSTANPNC
jgi:hypothetical protein